MSAKSSGSSRPSRRHDPAQRGTGPAGRRREGARPLAEIVPVGRELLEGRTTDTNSAWIARRLTRAGWRVGRISAVDDEVTEIAAAVSGALGRAAALVVTTGGLGPTSDDLTLEGVARATGRPLRPDARARRLVAGFYRALPKRRPGASGRMTPQRWKMALLPEGAEPLPNSAGAAPGSLLRAGEAIVLSLPGVPAEMTAIFEEQAEPRLRDLVRTRGYQERTILLPARDESSLSPLLDRVRGEFPGLYVKSLAGHYRADRRLRVILSGTGGDERELTARLEAASMRLRTLAKRLR